MCRWRLVQDSADPSEQLLLEPYSHFQCKKNVVVTSEQCQMGRAKPHAPPRSRQVGKKSPQMIWNRHLINFPPIKVSERLTLHAIYSHSTPSFWPICPQLRPEECKDKVTHAIHIGSAAIILRRKNHFPSRKMDSPFFFSPLPPIAKCQRTPRECRLLF